MASGTARGGSDSLFFFRSEAVYRPLEAGILESRLGFQKYTNTENLKLDIGASVDVAGIRNGNNIYSIGADLFTFSNLRSEDNFKFPVDAIDYMFGINLNAGRTFMNGSTLSARFRLAHVSAHLQDGHVYERSDTIFTPFVFSKEFVDLSAIYRVEVLRNTDLRLMAGANYIFHAIPEEISPVSGQAGIEAVYYPLKFMSLYVSSELNLAEVKSSTNLNISMEAGVTFAAKNSRGITLFFSYYDGQDYRGQYYGNYLNTKGLGLKIRF